MRDRTADGFAQWRWNRGGEIAAVTGVIAGGQSVQFFGRSTCGNRIPTCLHVARANPRLNGRSYVR